MIKLHNKIFAGYAFINAYHFKVGKENAIPNTIATYKNGGSDYHYKLQHKDKEDC